MPVRLTGRSAPTYRSGRTSPYVRFRRSGLQERVEQKKTNHKNRAYRHSHWLGLLTPVGLTTSLAVLLLLVGGLWFFVFSTSFLIDEVKIVGPTSLTRSQINKVFYALQDKRVLFFIPANHVVFLSKKRMAGELKNSYPHIAEVSHYDRTLPNQISFAVLEKKPAFVLTADNGSRYLLDEDGFSLGEALSALPAQSIDIRGNLSTQAEAGTQIVGVPVLSFASSVQKKWPADWSFRPVQYEILTEVGSGEFKILLNEGWFVKAAGANSAESLVANVQTILANEFDTDEKRRQLSYIDLRLTSRAFYCLKDKPCAK